MLRSVKRVYLGFFLLVLIGTCYRLSYTAEPVEPVRTIQYMSRGYSGGATYELPPVYATRDRAIVLWLVFSWVVLVQGSALFALKK